MILQNSNFQPSVSLAKFHPSVHSLSSDHLVQKRAYDSIWASESQALTVGERTGTDAETFQGVLEAIAHSKEWGCLKREPTKRKEGDQILLISFEERFNLELVPPRTSWLDEPIIKFSFLLPVVQIGYFYPSHVKPQPVIKSWNKLVEDDVAYRIASSPLPAWQEWCTDVSGDIFYNMKPMKYGKHWGGRRRRR